MSLIIRKMKKEDIQSVMKICIEIRDYHRDILGGYFTKLDEDFELKSLLNMIDDENSIALVADRDNEIIGLAFAELKTSLVMEKSKICHIHNIGVLKEIRGQGIGKAMMDFLYEECKNKEIDEIKLGVFNANVDSYKFYEKYGFKPLEQRMNLMVK